MAPRPLLRTAYWSDPPSKAAFRDLARDSFGLDFSAWDEAGYWDDDFRPFTFFDAEGRALANVCAYSMELVVAGQPVRAAQFSTVATRPELRRRGLARELVEAAYAWAHGTGHAFTYLFANSDAAPFYVAAGFRPWTEQCTALTLHRAPAPRAGARSLDLGTSADRALLFAMACEREPVSAALGARNSRLLMFHALGPLRTGCLHILPLETVVLFERNGGSLTLHDIVARRVPPLIELLPFLAAESDREIVFRFLPDRLGSLSALGTASQRAFDNGLHVRGAVPLPPVTLFPATSQA